MKRAIVVNVAFIALTVCSPVDAAELAAAPIYKAPPAPVTPSGDFFFFVDGSWQSIKLPHFALGYKTSPPATFTDGPVRDNYDPRATGHGISGGVGYAFRDGTFSPLFGSTVRIQIALSYIDADVRQSGGSAPSSADSLLQLLAGTFRPGIGASCNGAAGSCTTASSLSSHFTAWQGSLKTAADYRFGLVTFTPSLAAFGGDSRNRQDFLQNLVTSVAGSADTYNANTVLHWKDWGAKVGLDANVNVTHQLSVGLGGNLGLASRHVSLNGNDSQVSTPGGPVGGNSSSSITSSATTTAFVATAEAGITIRPQPTMTVRGFVGLNYDSRVPGISTPHWTGSALAPTSITPAGINFSSETSYYAGGGITVRW
jgi:hypothetical protein